MKEKEITITRKVLIEDCPYCQKEIRGSTESHVRYNLKLHIQAKHKFQKSNKEKKLEMKRIMEGSKQ